MKNQNKTQRKSTGVQSYIRSLEPKSKADAQALLKLFTDTTEVKAAMWGDSIVGFGEYHYKYDSGREGDFLATGFSIRKSGPTLYIMPGYNNYTHLLQKLGPHKLGKSCLYLKNLEEVDFDILKKIITAGLTDLNKQYPVNS